MATELESRIVLAASGVAAAFARHEAGDEEVFYLAAALVDAALAGDREASALGTQAVSVLIREFDGRRAELTTLRLVAWLLERRLGGSRRTQLLEVDEILRSGCSALHCDEVGAGADAKAVAGE